MCRTVKYSHSQELGEVNCAVSVSVHLIDHVLKLCLGWVLTKRPVKDDISSVRILEISNHQPHDSPQLLGGDGAVTVLVKQRESLLELGNLILS